MSRALQLLACLEQDGIRLQAQREQLLATPASLLTDADRADLREHRAELLQLLAGDADDLAMVFRALEVWGLL